MSTIELDVSEYNLPRCTRKFRETTFLGSREEVSTKWKKKIIEESTILIIVVVVVSFLMVT